MSFVVVSVCSAGESFVAVMSADGDGLGGSCAAEICVEATSVEETTVDSVGVLFTTFSTLLLCSLGSVADSVGAVPLVASAAASASAASVVAAADDDGGGGAGGGSTHTSTVSSGLRDGREDVGRDPAASADDDCEGAVGLASLFAAVFAALLLVSFCCVPLTSVSAGTGGALSDTTIILATAFGAGTATASPVPGAAAAARVSVRGRRA